MITLFWFQMFFIEYLLPFAENCTTDEFVPNPNKRIIKFFINGFYVFDGQLSAQHALVEGQRKSSINELAVIQSLKK